MQTRSALAGSALLALVAGCGTLADATSPLIGCRTEDITIVEDHVGAVSRNWVAECLGERYLCGTVGRQVACAPERTDAGGPQGAAPISTAAVERSRDAAGHVRLRMTVTIGELETEFQASPSQDAARMYLIIRGQGVNLDCPAGALIDGAIEPLTRSHADSGASTETYLGSLALTTLRQMLTARRAAIRICDAEGRIDTDSRAALEEFAARFDEELAWQHGATSGAESAAPRSAATATTP